jgi:hypothetical protein
MDDGNKPQAIAKLPKISPAKPKERRCRQDASETEHALIDAD